MYLYRYTPHTRNEVFPRSSGFVLRMYIIVPCLDVLNIVDAQKPLPRIQLSLLMFVLWFMYLINWIAFIIVQYFLIKGILSVVLFC